MFPLDNHTLISYIPKVPFLSLLPQKVNSKINIINVVVVLNNQCMIGTNTEEPPKREKFKIAVCYRFPCSVLAMFVFFFLFFSTRIMLHHYHYYCLRHKKLVPTLASPCFWVVLKAYDQTRLNRNMNRLARAAPPALGSA